MTSLPLPLHVMRSTDPQLFYSHDDHSSSIPVTPDLDALSIDSSLRSTAQPRLNPPSPLLDTSAPFQLPSVFPLLRETPICEEKEPQLDLSLGLSATHASLPTPTIHRTNHNLRLPPFDVLGIAAPHPDHLPLRTTSSFALGCGPLSKPEDPLHALSPPLNFTTHTEIANIKPNQNVTPATSHLGHLVSTITPPSELGPFSWASFVNVRSVAVGSTPNSEPGLTPNLNVAASAASARQAPIIVPTYAALSHEVGTAAWVAEVKNTIINESDCISLNSVKILSHALPYPSSIGHLFGHVISAIHNQIPNLTSWISVFHVVSGRYILSDLPKSPPPTPIPVVADNSYFPNRVFDSAVAIPEYHLNPTSSLSSQTLVPPESINVCVVERYVPPTNANEIAEMFALGRRSLLHDRLLELSPEKGIMLFIYPTRAGAQTFMQQYLGPILDPLLRTVTVVHDLHCGLGNKLGQMSAVHHLEEYDQLEMQIKKFCETLSLRSSNSHTGMTYQLVSATKQQVVLNRNVWADDWWIKQEKPRIREDIISYFRKSTRLPVDDMTSVQLVREILEGVSKREYPDGSPEKGIEVGVFIIKKTRSV